MRQQYLFNVILKGAYYLFILHFCSCNHLVSQCSEVTDAHHWVLRTVEVTLTGCTTVNYASLGGSQTQLNSQLGVLFTATFDLVQRYVVECMS